MTAPDTAHPLTTALRRAGHVADAARAMVIEINRIPGEQGRELRRLLAEVGAALVECGKG